MTDTQFQAFSDSLDDACRKSPRGAERDAAVARADKWNAELTHVQTTTKGGKSAVLIAVEALCVRYGWTA